MALHCIKCEREVENFCEEPMLVPDNAVSFVSYGNYGSTIYDPVDGSYIHIVVCDKCTLEHFQKYQSERVTSEQHNGETYFTIHGTPAKRTGVVEDTEEYIDVIK